MLIKILSLLIAASMLVNPLILSFAQVTETSSVQKAEDNAAVYYEKAFSLLKEYSVEETKEWEAVIKNGWKEENKKLEDVLRENEPALQEMKKGLNLEKCDFTYNKPYSYLIEKSIPNIYKSRLLSNLIILKGSMLEKNNDFEHAIEEYLSLLKFSQHITQGVSLVETTISVVTINMAYRALSQYVVRPDAQQSILQKVNTSLKTYAPKTTQIATVIESDKKSMLSVVQHAVDKGLIEARGSLSVKDYYNSFVSSAEVLGNKYYSKLIKAAQTNALADKQAYEREVVRLGKELNSITNVIRTLLWPMQGAVKALVFSMLPPATCLDNFYCSIAQYRIIQTVIAIKKHNFDNAFMPDTLESLVPEYIPDIPIDPYSQQALKFKKIDSGFVIYSIGKDRIDNKGTGHFEKDTQGEDIALSFAITK